MGNENVNDVENNVETIDKEVVDDVTTEQERVLQDEENELIYQYPVENMLGDYEDYFKQEYQKNKKVLRNLMFMCIGFLISFTLYCVPALSSFSTLFLIVSIAILVVTFMLAKAVTNKKNLHFLSINADEKRLKLTYYTQAKHYKREYNIMYKNIVSCRFCNSDFTKIQFIVSRTKCKAYDINNIEISNEPVTYLVFNINPLSYEQGFFMYVADKFFDIKGYKLTNKIIKKYGDADEYFDYLQEGSGEE